MRPVALAVALAVALGVAACSGAQAPPRPSPATSTSTETTPAAGTASTLVRAGLWRSVVTRPNGPTTTEDNCANGSVEDFLGLPQVCDDASISRTPQGWIVEAQCNSDVPADHIRADVRGDLESHFTVDFTRSVPGSAQPAEVQHLDNSYVGVCEQPD